MLTYLVTLLLIMDVIQANTFEKHILIKNSKLN